MPANELTYRRKRRRGRKFKKGPGLTKKQAGAVKAIVNKKLNQTAELKHHDILEDNKEIGNFGFQATTQFYNLTSISQAVGDTARIGDRFMLRSIFLRLILKLNSSPVERSPIVRVIVFQWKQDNASLTPVASDLLQGAVGNNEGSIILPYTLDKNNKYKILFDKLFHLSSSGGQELLMPEIYIAKGFAKQIQYGNAATTGMNQIYMMVQTSDIQGLITLNELPLMTLRGRVRYHDA